MRSPKQSFHNLRKLITYKTAFSPVLNQSRFWVSTVGWCVILTGSAAIVWLYFARTEEIVQATGLLEPVGQVKDVQTPIGGVISRLHVREGQQVKKGSLVMEIDNTKNAQLLESQIGILKLKKDQARLKQIEIASTKKDIVDRITKLEQILKTNKVVLSRFDRLRSGGAISDIQYLQQADRVVQLTGQAMSTAADGNSKVAALEREYRQISLEIIDLERQISETRKDSGYFKVKAPEDGKIFELQVRAAGYTVDSGSLLFKLVPKNSLLARVQIPSAKVGLVSVGLPVDVSIDSFPASEYGVIPGTITKVSADSLPPDPSLGYNFFRYPATIKLTSESISLRNGKIARLDSGMSIVANIKLRRVRYLDLLLRDLAKKSESLQRQ